jgi:hypothetical protein
MTAEVKISMMYRPRNGVGTAFRDYKVGRQTMHSEDRAYHPPVGRQPAVAPPVLMFFARLAPPARRPVPCAAGRSAGNRPIFVLVVLNMKTGVGRPAD